MCVKECPTFDYNAIKYDVKATEQKDKEVVEGGYPGPLDYQNFASDFGGLSHTKDPNMTE